MGTLGRTDQTYRSGYDDHIAAAGDIEWLFVGATVDWDTVAAAAAAVTLGSGRTIASGQKYLLRGQFMTRITGGGGTVATQNNTPTGGTKTFTVTTLAGSFTTAAVAYNETGANIQTIVRALDASLAAATVTGSAGGPYTFGFPSALGSVSVSANGAALTGAGAQPTVTFAVSSTGRVGWFGPYDPNATDGRATIARGDCGLVPRTTLLGGTLGLNERDDQHKGLIVAGHVWNGRVVHSGVAAHTLAAGPTRAELLAGLPEIVLVPRSY